MNQSHAKVSKGNRISAIWLLPILVFLVGGWVVFQSIANQGPVVLLEFSTAEGMTAGKTKIKARNVEVGVVEEIRLSDDYQKVLVSARLNRSALPMLVEDSVFWVVKPRVGVGGISGVSTLLSGAYIKLEPGSSDVEKRRFSGSDGVKITPLGTPGVRVILRSDEAKSMSVGSPVHYRGLKVGWIEGSDFDSVERLFEYEAFIEDPFSGMLSTSSRFWNVSGVSIEADVNGVSVNTSSLESFLSGGVTFDLPEKARLGEAISDGHVFDLYSNYSSVQNEPFAHYIEYFLMFETSVRGLRPGAPVEYRGIKIGSVVDISFNYLSDDGAEDFTKIPVPVKIRIDPARLDWDDSEEACVRLADALSERVDVGMRARLETGNLLTGSLFVSLDFYEEAEIGQVEMMGDLRVFPTVSSGLAQIENKVVKVLDLFLELPWEETLKSAEGAMNNAVSTLVALESLVEKLDELLAKEETQALPASMKESLDELQKVLSGYSSDSEFHGSLLDVLHQVEGAMNGVEDLTEILKTKPNALIFSGKKKNDPEPKGRLED